MWQEILYNLQHYPSLVLVATVVVVLLAGLAAQILANRLEVPSILFLLLSGIALGPDGLGLVRPEVLGDGLRAIISICVAIIVFEGALMIDVQHLRNASRPVLGLISIGVIVTTVGATLLAMWIMGLPWNVALLFGAIVSVTGPTVITPILKRVPLSPRLRTTLEGESVFADGVGVILAASIFSFITAGHGDLAAGFARMFSHLLIGSAIGGAFALASRWALHKLSPLPGEHVRLAVLGTALLVYTLAELIAHETGIMAVAVAGFVFGSGKLPYDNTIKQFKGDLTLLSLSLVFILLGANLPLESIYELGWPAVLLVLLLMVVVRPLCVLASTWGTDMPWREKGFLMVLAPRGIVAASVATFFSIELAAWGIQGSQALSGLVFLLVIITVATEGVGAPFTAQWLGVIPKRILVLGGDKQARRLSEELKRNGEAVQMLDDSLDNVHSLLLRHLPAKLCRLDSPQALARCGAKEAKALVVATDDDDRNYELAQVIHQAFPDVKLWVRLNDESHRERFQDQGFQLWTQLEVSPFSVWSAAISPEVALEAEVSNPAITGQPLATLGLPSGCLLIALKRDGRTIVPRGQTELVMGDVVTIVGEGSAVGQARELLQARPEPLSIY